MYVERLHLRNRRRSQHSCRPPPAPLTIVLCRAPTFTLDTELLHTPPHACLVAAAERLSANLFCNFSRWATVVHRTVPPRTIVQAAQCLGPLRWPAKPLALTCDTTQTHAFAFGKHLRLNTEKLLSIELQDLRWLAHATNAWRSCAGSKHAPQTNRSLFVLNDVFQRAHKAMLAHDNNTWGGLVPPQLACMLLHACKQCKPKPASVVMPSSSSKTHSC